MKISSFFRPFFALMAMNLPIKTTNAIKAVNCFKKPIVYSLIALTKLWRHQMTS